MTCELIADSLNNDTPLPELNFEDLLDALPIKKTPVEEDPLQLTDSPKEGTKKSHVLVTGSKTIIYNKNGTENTAQHTPLLLNSKNILPKTASPLINNIIKLTPKISATNPVTINSGNMSIGQMKMPLKTATGKLIIQKAPNNSAGVKLHQSTGNSGFNVKTVTPSSTTPLGRTITTGGGKPVSIQFVRTADGTLVPLKNTGKTSTLTLSPTTTWGGRKIISTHGGQVVIKTPLKALTTVPSSPSTVATGSPSISAINTLTGAKTSLLKVPSSSGDVANTTNKSKTIVVQSTIGKHIIVSNQNLVKIPSKGPITTTSAINSSSAASVSASSTITTTSKGTTGQLHAIQLANKSGLQYVRVMPTAKVNNNKSVTTTATTTATSSSTISSSSSTATIGKLVTIPNSSSGSASFSTINSNVKILNALPQKLMVQQKLMVPSVTKVVVTQQSLNKINNLNSSSTNTNSTMPTTSSQIAGKGQKSIVALPTLRPLIDDKNKTSVTVLRNGSGITPATVVKKHKLENGTGGPDCKKIVSGRRFVLLSNSAQKSVNNAVQVQGRLNTTTPITTTQNIKSVAGGTSTTTSATTTSLISKTNNKQLYSVLKPPQSPSSTPSPSSTNVKTLTLTAQQHQKLQQLTQKFMSTNKNYENNNKKTSTTNSVNVPLTTVKIKEEPDDTTKARIKPMSVVSVVLEAEPSTANDEPLVGGIRRKHCNCSKSQCLKLYCDCFANGEFCQDCTCKDCLNNLQYEDERQRAIRNCLGRNPSAFKPKIVTSKEQTDMRLHHKGCNCKRSGCLKNYCECYEAKIPCSSNCKCVGCRNIEDVPDLDMDPIDSKVLASMGGSGGGGGGGVGVGASTTQTLNQTKRAYDKGYGYNGGPNNMPIKMEKPTKDSNKNSNSLSDGQCGASSNANTMPPPMDKQQCNFITQEVIDATIQCMIVQADECEKNGLPAYQTEKMVMEELGRCLVEIIDFSIRNTDNSFSQD